MCVNEVARVDTDHGKKLNASRVALVTGVDRGEVTRILNSHSKAKTGDTRRHRVNRLLAAWHSDPEFSNGGRPLVLPIKPGDRKRGSFWALAKQCAPGVYPGLILSELLRVGAVETIENGRIKVLARHYQAAEFTEESISEIRTRVRDLMQTMLNNATEANWPRVCRTVETTEIDPKFLPLIRKMLSDRSEAALSGVQEELTSTRWKRTGASRPGVRVGLTVFTHEETESEAASNENDKGSQSSWEPRQQSAGKAIKSGRSGIKGR